MKNWKDDIVAALSVSFVAIPQALAYATMAGLPAYTGLYATAVPTIIAALSGSSTILSTGPVATISLLTAAALVKYAANPLELIAAAAVLSMLVGFIQIVLSIVRAGSLINFIAHPVLIGFTTAAACIIWFSQVPTLLGVVVSDQPYFYKVFVETMVNLNSANVYTATIGIGSIFTVLLLRKFFPHAPAALIVIIAGALLGNYLGYAGPIVGDVPRGFRLFELATMSTINVTGLVSDAFAIAVIGFISGTSVIKQLAVQSHDKVNPHREMFAQGLANITSGIFGSYPVAGSISRTALNMAAGAQSRFASVGTGIVAIIVMLFFTPLFYYVNYASLAAIIMVTVAELINFKEIVRLSTVKGNDGLVALVTLSATLYFAPHFDIGIMIGVCAATISKLYKTVRHL
ncbi:MAG: putative sulfate transporter [Microgenomates bacterium OLB23]|nr:MAG: putative sulfate transporter [Microgenomates bacterium OLB23]